jgi:CxxC-x17-CxxC domain-containing protein
VRPETRTTCSECGTETTVPFKPTQGRPVLCRSCFQKQQGGQVPAPQPSAAQD